MEMLCTGDRVKEITFCDLKNIDQDNLINSMQLTDIKGDSIEDLLVKFKLNVENALDLHAPEITIRISDRPNKLWYNNSLNSQLRIVRNRERIYRKYKENHQWLAYKEQLNKYNKMLYKFKSEYITSEVLKFKGDTKNLYGLMSKLTGI